ncbi:type I restriction and modification enzyme subunit R-like protein [Arthrobacter sp. SLBN-100]|uniref:type I restriction endonuclease n=1 Tax=Arthrobacter sp. SLBN-100 TaxID=2768450 RepID=UPI001169F50A|nr:type I restriction endonuclease [Arthrobacter sp. SLBN-100]TQJ66837.1 type I restriction and modification enzyme subunit R-like protein [Arthrobacter sp. SLBN-100]
MQGDYKRRFDVVLYCNGMPVSIIELKKAGSAHADLPGAHAQLQTYLREFPTAFRFWSSRSPPTESRPSTEHPSPPLTTSHPGM